MLMLSLSNVSNCRRNGMLIEVTRVFDFVKGVNLSKINMRTMLGVLSDDHEGNITV